MNVEIKRFALTFSASLVLWIASTVLFGVFAEAMLGAWDSGRVFPFNNAHLLEEAAEGIYSPLKDPVFVIYSIAVAAVAFGLSAFWGAQGATKAQLRQVSMAISIGIILFALHLHSAFSSVAPASIRDAAEFSLAISFIAATIGVAITRFSGAKNG